MAIEKTLFAMILFLVITIAFAYGILGYQFGIYQKYNISTTQKNFTATILPLQETATTLQQAPDCTNKNYISCGWDYVTWTFSLTFLNSDIAWLGYLFLALGVVIIIWLIKDVIIPLVPDWL